MSDLRYSALLQTLSEDYANNRLTFEQYRSQRKIILLQIDKEYNYLTYNAEPQSKEFNIM